MTLLTRAGAREAGGASMVFVKPLERLSTAPEA